MDLEYLPTPTPNTPYSTLALKIGTRQHWHILTSIAHILSLGISVQMHKSSKLLLP